MALQGANILVGGLGGHFDGHAHIFEKSLELEPNRRYTPKNDALLDDYLELLRLYDLEGAILVQPSFLGTDNSYLLDALSRAPTNGDVKLRGVAMLDPVTTAEELALLNEAGIVGLRLNVVGRDRAAAFGIGMWKPLLNMANDLGWHVELHCNGQELVHLLPLVLLHANRVVVDHFGLPDRDDPANCAGWAALRTAPVDRVFVKVSAPYRVFPNRPVAEAAELCQPVFKRLFEAFGPERLLWGSDWPWTQFDDDVDFDAVVDWKTMWLAAVGQ